MNQFKKEEMNQNDSSGRTKKRTRSETDEKLEEPEAKVQKVAEKTDNNTLNGTAKEEVIEQPESRKQNPSQEELEESDEIMDISTNSQSLNTAKKRKLSDVEDIPAEPVTKVQKIVDNPLLQLLEYFIPKVTDDILPKSQESVIEPEVPDVSHSFLSESQESSGESIVPKYIDDYRSKSQESFVEPEVPDVSHSIVSQLQESSAESTVPKVTNDELPKSQESVIEPEVPDVSHSILSKLQETSEEPTVPEDIDDDRSKSQESVVEPEVQDASHSFLSESQESSAESTVPKDTDDYRSKSQESVVEPEAPDVSYIILSQFQENSVQSSVPKATHDTPSKSQETVVEPEVPNDPLECAICKEVLTTEVIGQPENCTHKFCLACLIEAAKRDNKCPLDRQPFNKILLPNAKDANSETYVNIFGGEADNEEENIEFLELELWEEFAENEHCEICGVNTDEVIRSCFYCLRGFHLNCLTPPVTQVPVLDGRDCCLRCQQRACYVCGENSRRDKFMYRCHRCRKDFHVSCHTTRAPPELAQEVLCPSCYLEPAAPNDDDHYYY